MCSSVSVTCSGQVSVVDGSCDMEAKVGVDRTADRQGEVSTMVMAIPLVLSAVDSDLKCLADFLHPHAA